jgi:hypothetical protein
MLATLPSGAAMQHVAFHCFVLAVLPSKAATRHVAYFCFVLAALPSEAATQRIIALCWRPCQAKQPQYVAYSDIHLAETPSSGLCACFYDPHLLLGFQLACHLLLGLCCSFFF